MIVERKKKYTLFALLVLRASFVFGARKNLIALNERSNQSGMIRGISEMVNLLAPKSLVILVQNETKIDRLDKLTVMIHHHNIPTCVYYDLEQYFSLIEENLEKSLEITSLIFCHPEDMLQDITDRRLAHRLSLFIFYWGASQLPATLNHNLLKEPFRVAIITNPRRNIFRIFYNQAKPNNRGDMVSVNWFDGNDMTFKRVPLLPSPTEVYKNFDGRIFSIPVIHKPPWHFIIYGNVSTNAADMTNGTNSDDAVGFEMELEKNVTVESDDTYFTVKGGRDHNLMQLIAERMNFSFQYVEPPEKIQGIALGSENNASFSGALGMLQRREVELYLGDVAVTWERMKAVEFSFFTLADSAAFVTHAPRKLNEALALVRPFQITVWPPVIITILISGPILYIIISTPYRWRYGYNRGNLRQRNRHKKFRQRKPAFYNIRYIEEMSYTRVTARRTYRTNDMQEYPSLDRCIWYTINVYLRQSANIPFDGHLARFFSILLWLCATYVLGDVYSAQLTSQLARPARESPINTLGRLENRMTRDGYELLVERQSAFHAALVNSTGVLQRLYRLTRQRSVNDSFLVKSVEEGIRVLQSDPKYAVFGGRETLYFNTKRYGANRFQLSEKLYTRYSAVAVQIGCPFLDSLNDVYVCSGSIKSMHYEMVYYSTIFLHLISSIMRLFEAGIVEKITIAEYEQMFGRHKGSISHSEETVRSTKSTNSECDTDGTGSKRKTDSNDKLQPMNLRMLQGAFLVLACGHILGGICLFVERHIKMINSCGETIGLIGSKLKCVIDQLCPQWR
ncbi:ionotropic receptor 40a isoform X2 [Anopheles funestus]|uniref:ionotropic receptor 40a isoform X2 n=1 Tax=Anopheles funestus TaxID=62324 RepID=UPI0020C71971|nr:ionotropic receptor 40a isoform X2 [Anopheles funestus]